jgi:hypothetical protein
MVNDVIELTIDGVNVKIEDVLSLSFNDAAGVKSDKVTLSVMPNFPKPKPSAKLELIFKTFKDGNELESLNCGLFHVQTVVRKDVKLLSFTATGVEFNDKQKIKLSNHYQGTKLSSIVQIVADRLGHKVKFQTDDVDIKSLNQTNESDINFLNRLAQTYNCLFSIKNDYIYFVDKDDGSLPVTKIDVSKCKSSSIKHSTKTYYKSCEASWHDIDSGKIKKVTFGDGSPVLKIDGSYIDENDALAKAKAKLKSINKGTVSGSLSLKGREIYAGTKVELVNTYNNEDDGVYSVVSCTHRYTIKNGWIVDVEIEN